MDRNIEFGTLDRTARGNSGAGEFDVALASGYDFKVGNFTLGPLTTLQYTYLRVQGFTETGRTRSTSTWRATTAAACFTRLERRPPTAGRCPRNSSSPRWPSRAGSTSSCRTRIRSTRHSTPAVRRRPSTSSPRPHSMLFLRRRRCGSALRRHVAGDLLLERLRGQRRPHQPEHLLLHRRQILRRSPSSLIPTSPWR